MEAILGKEVRYHQSLLERPETELDPEEIIGNEDASRGTVCAEGSKDTFRPRSPGMKYKHYAPKAKILPVDAPDFEAFAAYVKANNGPGTWCLLYDSDPELPEIPCMRYGDTGREQAHFLFLRFRELDEAGASKVYVRIPKQSGADLSVYNRLMRAAGFEVMKL